MGRKIVRRKAISKAPVIMLFLLILILLAMLVTVFVMFVLDDLNVDPMDQIILPPIVAVDTEGTNEMPGDIFAAAVTSREAERASAAASNFTQSGDITTKRVKVNTVVPESPAADLSYFDDAVFIGDSVTQGFRNSGFFPAKNIVAEKNVNLNKIVANEACYKGNTQTLYQMIAAQMPNPKKIYILLGLNNLPGTSNENSMIYYKQMLQQIKEKFPNTIIYVESLTPMMKNSEYTKSFSQDKINDFNERLEALAKEEQVYYLNLQEALKDGNGYLVGEYASIDGLHMVTAGHKIMYQYFLTHTVQEDGYTDAIVK